MKQHQTTVILSCAVVLLCIVAGTITFYKNKTTQDFYVSEVEEREQINLALLAETPEDFTFGSADPKIRLVVYSDADCPYCEKFEPVLNQLLDEYPDDVAITYRHYELPIHPYAQFEHTGLECVGMISGSEKYRSLQDEVLFKNQFSTEEDAREQIFSIAQSHVPEAEQEAVGACIVNGDGEERINNKINSGTALGVQQTPTWFVIHDGVAEKFIGQISYETLVYRLQGFGL